MNIQPVILAGGTGTRLWPLSRSMHPKQFLPLAKEGTLLGETLGRLKALASGQPSSNPLVICNKENRFFVAEHFRESGIDDGDIILEPCGRNTAPALTLAALHILSSGDDAIMLVSPADHMISDIPAFNQSLSVAIDHADKGHIVTLGIAPTYAETGFGYIKLGKLISPETGLDFYLDQFVEKPNAETAETYLDAGDYLWNSGMFVLKASIWLENIKTFQPEIFNQCQSDYEKMRKDGYFHWIDETAFIACPNDSIDYAVMEKQSKVDTEAPPCCG